MFDFILQQSVLQKIIINTLFVSIPEELFLVMFTLIMVGEFEYWQEPECKRLINRFDYVRVFLPTIVGALLFNILINAGLNYGIYHYITPIVIYILIVLTNDVFGDASAAKWMVKALIFFMIAFLSIGIFEFAYMPLLLYSTGLTMDNIRDNLLIYFITSLPSRLFQFSLLSFLVSRKRTLLRGRLIRDILSQPALAVIFCSLVLFNILLLNMFGTAIVVDKVLISISRLSQILIITGVTMFPFLNIFGFLWVFYLLKNREIKDKKNAFDRLQILLKDIELYTNTGEYKNIKWKLTEISMGIEDVSKTLYKENETGT